LTTQAQNLLQYPTMNHLKIAFKGTFLDFAVVLPRSVGGVVLLQKQQQQPGASQQEQARI